MPRKPIRPKSRKKVDDLDFPQEMELALGATGLARDSSFPDPWTRKKMYFHHRDYLIREGIGARPGRRPGSFFEYEHPGHELHGDLAQWEILLDLGEMGPEETAAVRGEWIANLDFRHPQTRSAFDSAARGRAPMHGNPDWPTLEERYTRQAAALGPVAVGEWKRFRTALEATWEEEGCQGCLYDLSLGHCKRMDCKHWKPKAQAARLDAGRGGEEDADRDPDPDHV